MTTVQTRTEQAPDLEYTGERIFAGCVIGVWFAERRFAFDKLGPRFCIVGPYSSD
jgi:hypothetical protein